MQFISENINTATSFKNHDDARYKIVALICIIRDCFVPRNDGLVGLGCIKGFVPPVPVSHSYRSGTGGAGNAMPPHHVIASDRVAIST